MHFVFSIEKRAFSFLSISLHIFRFVRFFCPFFAFFRGVSALISCLDRLGVFSQKFTEAVTRDLSHRCFKWPCVTCPQGAWVRSRDPLKLQARRSQTSSASKHFSFCARCCGMPCTIALGYQSSKRSMHRERSRRLGVSCGVRSRREQNNLLPCIARRSRTSFSYKAPGILSTLSNDKSFRQLPLPASFIPRFDIVLIFGLLIVLHIKGKHRERVHARREYPAPFGYFPALLSATTSMRLCSAASRALFIISSSVAIRSRCTAINCKIALL